METLLTAGFYVVFFRHSWPSVYHKNAGVCGNSMASQVIISATALLGHNGIMPQAPERSRKMLQTIVHCSVPRPVKVTHHLLICLTGFCSKDYSMRPVGTILYTYWMYMLNYLAELAGEQLRSSQCPSCPVHLWLPLTPVLIPCPISCSLLVSEKYVAQIVTIYGSKDWVGLPKDGTRHMKGQDSLAFPNTVDIDNTIQYHPKLGQSMTLGHKGLLVISRTAWTEKNPSQEQVELQIFKTSYVNQKKRCAYWYI